MDAVEPIIPFLAWVVLGFIGVVGALMVASVNRYLDSMQTWQKETNDKLDEHGNRIIKLETQIGGH